MAEFEVNISGGSSGTINFSVHVRGLPQEITKEDNQAIVKTTRYLVEQLHLERKFISSTE